MPTTGTSSIEALVAAALNSGRPEGLRALIEFTPKPTSDERLCAGVVVRTTDGEVTYACAPHARHMQHAFGEIGLALHDVAEKLCQSLANHWSAGKDPKRWVPPFSNARLTSLERFSASSAAEECNRILARTSTLYTLSEAYLHEAAPRTTGIVERVRSAVKRDSNAKHLAHRFNKQLTLNGEAQPLRVDFLGQRYACYFLQVTKSLRGLDATTDRAFGKLFELGALRRLIQKPTQQLGLLEDERPHAFELLMVGDRNDMVQRKAIYQVEALADRSEVVARIVPNVTSAADRVYHQERLAA